MKRQLSLVVSLLVLAVMVFSLAACNTEQKHEHTYGETWSSDATSHWKNATCEDNDECKSATAEFAAHSFNGDSCSVCGYTKTVKPVEHIHSYSSSWTSDETHHWHAAYCTGADDCATAVSDKAEHAFVDGKCVCGKEEAVAAADGTEANPFAFTVPGTVTVSYAENADPVWYAFTATETKTVRVVFSAGAVMGYYVDGTLTYTENVTSVDIDVVAGTTYAFNFSSADFAAAEIEVVADYIEYVFATAESIAGTYYIRTAGASGGYTEIVINADGTIVSSGVTYNFTIENNVTTVTINDMDVSAMMAIHINELNGEVSGFLWNGTEYSLATAPSGDEDEGDDETPETVLDEENSELVIGENTVTITDADIEAGAIQYTIVVLVDGTFEVTSNDVGATFVDADGMFLGFGMADLTAGTYTVNVLCGGVEEAGDYTFELTYQAVVEAEPGTMDNPILIETLPFEVTITGMHDVYYTFVATEDMAIILDAGNGSYIMSVDGEYVSANIANVPAGSVVVINVYTYEEDETAEYTYTVTKGEYAEAGAFTNPHTMYADDSFTCTYPGGNDADKYVWFTANIYDSGYFVITFPNRVNALYGTDAENLSTVSDATTKIWVEYGDVLYLAVQSFNLGEAEITFTTAWEWAPGTIDNPYVAVDGDNSFDINGAYELFFNYTPAANGTITVTFSGYTLNYYSTTINWWEEATTGMTFNVTAGVEFRIQAVEWADDATSVGFNITFEEKEVVDISGTLVDTNVFTTPAYMNKTDLHSFTATVAGEYLINVTGISANTYFQIYDAASDTSTRIKDFPYIITLAEGETLTVRLFNWDSAAVGNEVTFELYLVGGSESDDDEQKTAEELLAGTYENAIGVYGVMFFQYSETGVYYMNVWNGIWDLYYTYTAVINDDGTITIDPTFAPDYWASSGEVDVDGVADYTFVATHDGDSWTFSILGASTEESGLAGSGVNTDPYIITESVDVVANVVVEDEMPSDVYYAYVNNTENQVKVTVVFDGMNYFARYGTFNFMLLDKYLNPNAGGSFELTLAAGTTLFMTVSSFDGSADEISFSVIIEAVEEEEEPEAPVVSELVMGNVQINAENAVYSYTATEDGVLTLTAGAAIGGMVTMKYSVNNGDAAILELSTAAEIELTVGDVVVVTIEAEGYSSLTAAFALPSTDDEEEDDTVEGGEVANATYIANPGTGRKIMVVVNADGTIEITRSDYSGYFGTGGCTTENGTWEIVDGVFTVSGTTNAKNMSFEANGAPISITWGTQVFTGFELQA